MKNMNTNFESQPFCSSKIGTWQKNGVLIDAEFKYFSFVFVRNVAGPNFLQCIS